MNPPTQPAQIARPAWSRTRRLVKDGAIGLIFNIICAILITYPLRIGGTFVENLVFSICIGTLALLFIDGGRLVIWGEKTSVRPLFFVLVVAGGTAAYFLGNMIAMRILGIPGQAMLGAHAQQLPGLLILTLLACIFISWFFWSRARLQTLQAEAEAEKARAAAVERQAMQAQLQMLQAQIEPHMLFNTLANLQALIAVDASRAQRMLDQLIQYLRATLTSSRAEKTTLAQEFALMQAYLGLMSVRMGSRLSYALHLPEALRDVALPPMLLQPLVENAIKHGIEPKIDGGHIDVRAEREVGMLVLTVCDTGLGLDAASPGVAGTRVGVANVRERLQMQYGERASFALLPNTPAGVIATMRLPL